MTEQQVHTPEPISGQSEQFTGFASYWGTDQTERFFLPDGKQFFEFKPMNEGAKSRFQKKTNKGIRMDQRKQEALIDIDPAQERHILIVESVTNWNLIKPDPTTGQPVGYPCPESPVSRRNALEGEILDNFDPKIIQDLEFEIRKANPWMQADMDIAEIDKEMERLQELRQQALEQKAGEAGSANK